MGKHIKRSPMDLLLVEEKDNLLKDLHEDHVVVTIFLYFVSEGKLGFCRNRQSVAVFELSVSSVL